MIEAREQSAKSRELALELYDTWVRRRQDRPGFTTPKDKKELEALGLRNFEVQVATPRREHMEQLRRLKDALSFADKVSLLVALELPAVEISTLLHKLSMQLARDPKATYFSEVNQADNCGCGCGCGCRSMEELPYVERLNAHMDAKPYSIDPFNESGVSEKDREALLIRDFLDSYEALSIRVSEGVNHRYFQMGRAFS